MKPIVFFLSVILSVFLTTPAFSQALPETNCIVKGTLIDSVSNNSIPYATISLATVNKPTIYLKRLAADINGNFNLTLSKPDKYLLSFESVGMAKTVKAITVTDDMKNLNLGVIKMSASDIKLTELTITANKPLVKVDLDRISYDTKSDPESQSSNVLDMLRKVPMVTVDGEDNIQLKGSSSFRVFVNGKPSSMTATNPSQVLKSMPASSIKSIEVITEPGAKYEAEGLGGIINIVTEKAMSGYTGTVRAGIDTNGGYNGGIYFSTKRKKFGVTSNINYNKHVQPNRYFEVNRENTTETTSFKYLNQTSNQDVNIHYFYGNVEASYEIDSLNLISLNIGGHDGGHNAKVTAKSGYFDAQRDTIFAYNQYTEATGTWGGIDMTLDYQRSFKKPEKLVTASYKLSRTPNNTDNYSEFTALKNYTDSKQRIASLAQGNEHTFQLDYNEPFNKIHVAELGVKYILRLNDSENSYKQFNDQTNEWDVMPERITKDMNHTQHIIGAYGSYTLKLKKISLNTGVRLEHTNSIVEFEQVPSENFSIPFTNLVPTVAFTYKITDMSNLRLNYNQRIRRPGITYLNPFIDNSNPQSITYGNPNLDAEINNSFSLNYGNFTQVFNFNANLFASFTNNSIERVSELHSDGVVYTTYENIGYNQNAGLSVYGNLQLNKSIRLTINSSATYTNLGSDILGVANSGMRYTVSGSAQFTLPWELKLNVNGGYYSSAVSLQGTNPAFHYSALSLGRDFLNKKLNISLRVQDPFESNKNLFMIRETDLYSERTDIVMPARFFGINASYRFGEMKEQVKKAKRTITNDDVKDAEKQDNTTGQ